MQIFKEWSLDHGVMLHVSLLAFLALMCIPRFKGEVLSQLLTFQTIQILNILTTMLNLDQIYTGR